MMTMTMSEKTAYEAGSRAASSGYSYTDNPYISISEAGEKLAWSKGHNTYRANKQKVSMK
jgi:hypothetical protein